tara:strand:- start:3836 stop:4075 length:240 start_codon:yes stop_codon:yes gene_type:complete
MSEIEPNYTPLPQDDEPPPMPNNTSPQKNKPKQSDDFFTKLIDYLLENRIQIAVFVIILAAIWYYKNNQESSISAPKTA